MPWPAFNNYMNHTELPEHTLKQIKRFFEDYKALENKQVVVDDFMGPVDAARVLRESLGMYRQLRRGELYRK